MVPRLQRRGAESVQLTSQIEHFNEMCCASPIYMLDPNLSQMFSSRTQTEQRWVSEACNGNEVLCQQCSLLPLQGGLLPKHSSLHGSKRIPLPLNWAEVTTVLGVGPQRLDHTPRTDQSSSLSIDISHLSSGHPLEVAADGASLWALGKCEGSKGNPKTPLQWQYFTRFHQQFSGI